MSDIVNGSLILDKISKSYDSKKVISDFSYSFPRGCHVLIGQNGSGKSTLLKLICGAEKMDFGDIYFNNIELDINEVLYKSQLGYAPDKLMIYPFLTGIEFLNLVFSAKKVNDKHQIDEILDGFSIASYLSCKLEEMSLGNQKKFMLAAAFIGDPMLLLLDEPTNEIDTASKSYLTALLGRKIYAGRTIVCSSHDSDFISKIDTNKHYISEMF